MTSPHLNVLKPNYSANQPKLRCIQNVTQQMQSVERNPGKLSADLRVMARYLIVVGTNVEFVTDDSRKAQVLSRCDFTEYEEMKSIVEKYRLTWCNSRSDFHAFDYSNRPLMEVARNYPSIFIEEATKSSPSRYDERRLWWCANNYQFYKKFCRDAIKRQSLDDSQACSKLLSDVYYLLLLPEEEKSITICALHKSVKYKDYEILEKQFKRHLSYIEESVRENPLDEHTRTKLRRKFKVAEVERSLNPINFELFKAWWNLTGLRCENKYTKYSGRSSMGSTDSYSSRYFRQNSRPSERSNWRER